jgi:uncharacterized repeat protein (TIGR03943 family)
VRRETQNILLILLGGALLKLALTGMYLRYVKPALQPFLIVTGVIMVLLAVVAIARDMAAAKRAEVVEPDEHGHDHHHASRSPWMLLLPVLAVFLISPPALGADTVGRADNRNASQKSNQRSAFAQLPSDQVITMPMSDFVTRTAWDDSGSLNNRKVKLTGFVVRKDDAVYLARLIISCCAADASPVKVRMEGAQFDALAIDQWVEITGQVVPGSASKATSYVPTLTVADVQLIAAPPDPYES